MDLAKPARILIPPSSATAFATLVFTDKFAIAYGKIIEERRKIINQTLRLNICAQTIIEL